MSFLEISIIAAVAIAVFWPGGKRKFRKGALKWVNRKIDRPRTSTLPALAAEKEEEPAPAAAKPPPCESAEAGVPTGSAPPACVRGEPPSFGPGAGGRVRIVREGFHRPARAES